VPEIVEDGHPWLEKSRAELLEILVKSGITPQTPDSVSIRTVIENRLAEEQIQVAEKQLLAAAKNAEAGDHLAELTGALVAATRRLGTVTWYLVAGTFLLGASAAVDVILKIIREAR
jgi:hypothetical protein